MRQSSARPRDGRNGHGPADSGADRPPRTRMTCPECGSAEVSRSRRRGLDYIVARFARDATVSLPGLQTHVLEAKGGTFRQVKDSNRTAVSAPGSGRQKDVGQSPEEAVLRIGGSATMGSDITRPRPERRRPHERRFRYGARRWPWRAASPVPTTRCPPPQAARLAPGLEDQAPDAASRETGAADCFWGFWECLPTSAGEGCFPLESGDPAAPRNPSTAVLRRSLGSWCSAARVGPTRLWGP